MKCLLVVELFSKVVSEDVVVAVDQGKREGRITSTLCIDVKGAFDNVYRKRLLQTLKQMRLNPAIIR